MQKVTKKELERLYYYQTKQNLSQKGYKNKGHYIWIKGSIYQDDITTINIYVPNKRNIYETKYMKQKKDKTEQRNRPIYNNRW